MFTTVTVLVVAVVVIGVLLPGEDRGNDVIVTSAQYGGEWPFGEYRVGTVRCETRSFGGVNRPVVTVELGGRTYGLNGAATGVGGYPDALDVVAGDRIAGASVLADMIERGLEACP